MTYKNDRQKPEQVQEAYKMPQWVSKKAASRKQYTQKELAQAKERIPKQYHDFLILMPQNEKLTDQTFKVEQKDIEIGVFSYDRGTYLTIEKPYVTVDGRLKMFRDEHEKAQKKFTIHPPVIQQFNEKFTLLSITIDSEIYGSTTGTIEIGLGGKGADFSNPFANAQTSAIGRALGFFGYGLVGTGAIEDTIEPDQLEKEQPGKAPTVPNSPNQFRLLVLGKGEFNPDGTSTFEVQMLDKNVVKLVLPAAQRSFATKLQPNHVIHIAGWYNDGNKRILVADNSPSQIEQNTAS